MGEFGQESCEVHCCALQCSCELENKMRTESIERNHSKVTERKSDNFQMAFLSLKLLEGITPSLLVSQCHPGFQQ